MKQRGLTMRSWNKRTFARASCLAASLVIGASAPVYAEKVMNVIPHADLKNLDPIWTTAYISRNHGYMIYDTLFAMDDSFTPQPQMVDRPVSC